MGAHWLFCLVSIHAPVWVRRKSRGTALKASLFQFTHPCGCDPYRRHGLAQDGVFQFTHPCGCDLLLALREPSPFVSIHAPVWVRPTRYGYKCFYLLFQFTHPCGCDLPGPGRPALLGRFNSRTRVGATRRIRRRMQQEPVSIHAPVWVRHLWLVVCGIENKFQFTHPCGCDAREGAGFSCCTGFNSRTRVGATGFVW